MRADLLQEHPRPDFYRDNWVGLNGSWRFAFDDAEVGEYEEWYVSGDLSQTINVPFPYQSLASGIADETYHPIMWYARTFTVPASFDSAQVKLHFGAVDFHAQIWINGLMVGTHTGGYTPFSFLIDGNISRTAENLLVMKVVDRNESLQPRGKQYWKQENDRCWYTPCSGIWQTVWLESVPKIHLERLNLVPDIDTSTVSGIVTLSDRPCQGLDFQIAIHYEGHVVKTLNFSLTERNTPFIIAIKEPDSIDDLHHWSPETPNLYQVECILDNAGSRDVVYTYFGMRKISIDHGIIMFNNKPLYQRLILDQAYWEQSLLSAPDSEAFKRDVELIKSLGFNGVRLHQKIEDPRFYYWTDLLGLLVWGEMPSSYEFCSESSALILQEWMAFIQRDMNHPSIICWVPFNESWGLRNIYANQSQQQFAVAVYHLTKSMDPSRLVNTNDGWEQVRSDICGVHDYIADGKSLAALWKDVPTLMKKAVQKRPLYAKGFSYAGEPILISEFGGIAFAAAMDGKRWGYAGGVKNAEEFHQRIAGLVSAITHIQEVQGFCYTQLTDIMQEVNGLVHLDRTPKTSVDVLRRIFSGLTD